MDLYEMMMRNRRNAYRHCENSPSAESELTHIGAWLSIHDLLVDLPASMIDNVLADENS